MNLQFYLYTMIFYFNISIRVRDISMKIGLRCYQKSIEYRYIKAVD